MSDFTCLDYDTLTDTLIKEDCQAQVVIAKGVKIRNMWMTPYICISNLQQSTKEVYICSVVKCPRSSVLCAGRECVYSRGRV